MPRQPQVHDQLNGRVFEGSTPTAPWTAACVAHGTGQRISGAGSLHKLQASAG